MSECDIYGPLFKWAHRQGENFTTDAFVGLVKVLIHRNKDQTNRFLGWLCFDEESDSPFAGLTPTIDTQLRDPDGIPDVCVTAPEVYCLIEIKKDSGLHLGQLTQYRSILKGKGGKKTSLVLLTVFRPCVPKNDGDVVCRRWSDVDDWFEQNAFDDQVAGWLVQQFRSFLKGQAMTIEKVDRQYIEGIKALHNLMAMLDKALEQAKVPAAGITGSSQWQGCYVNDKQFWVGINMGEPQVLRFQFDRAKPDTTKLKQFGWELRDSKWATTLDLSDESVGFFELTKQLQQDKLIEFVKKAHDQAKLCIEASLSPISTEPNSGCMDSHPV